MSVELNAVLKGKVTGIQSFGAFVALEGENTQGLIHISEVSNTYVKDINEFLTVGQEVEVKVIKIDEEKNKISLSIRALMPDPEGNKGKKEARTERPRRNNAKKQRQPQAPVSYKSDPNEEGFNVLGEELKKALGL